MSLARLVTDVLGTSPEWGFVRAVVLVFAASAVIRLIPVRRNR
jgi:hypothetical protein